MRGKKIHEYKGKKVWYEQVGRLWHVLDKGEEYSFRGIEKLLKKHPDLTSVPAIQAALDRKIERKNRKKNPIPLEPKREKSEIKSEMLDNSKEKLVSCYYCSGTGTVSFGMTCPDCNGKGSFIVTSKGIGD
jgi:hypothetical protein